MDAPSLHFDTSSSDMLEKPVAERGQRRLVALGFVARSMTVILGRCRSINNVC
jgi:hypothetical protein